MLRRSFLLGAATGGALLAGTAAGYWRWQEIDTRVNYPGRAEGHFLRDRRALPPSSDIIDTDVVILGSGIAGLSAAWKMAKLGKSEFLIVEGPETYGNAAGAELDGYACPTGAHYLPLPSKETVHVREILADLGILLHGAELDKPYYDERYLLHAPEERLLLNGRWQEGLLPTEGVPAAELAEHKRFFAEIEQIRAARGSDGRRPFVFPSELSSADPAWRELDHISLASWLEQKNYRAASLRWYINYCCRDDYGRNCDEVSAWAGLHYFCSRSGQAENAGSGAWLTWPGGLAPLAQGLDRAAGGQRKKGSAVSLKTTANGVEALCFELVNGVARTYTVRARKAICAMPLFVAARVVQDMRAFGFDAAHHLPTYAPWMVANFLMRDFPQELADAPLSWDNVVCQQPGLGYVVSTHQDIRVAPPEKSVFSAYVALSHMAPGAARQWLDSVEPEALLKLAGADLKTAYGWRFAACAERVEITLRAHAMATPSPGFLGNPGIKALRELDGPILFAHADLSGFSVFEEAAWWGYRAGRLAAG